jgi:hypothetical protein
MELEAGVLVSPAPEVPVIDGGIVTPRFASWRRRGLWTKTIARELGVARTVSSAARRGGRPGAAGSAPPDRRRASDDGFAVHERGARQRSGRETAAGRAWAGGRRADGGAPSPISADSSGSPPLRRCASRRRRGSSPNRLRAAARHDRGRAGAHISAGRSSRLLPAGCS